MIILLILLGSLQATTVLSQSSPRMYNLGEFVVWGKRPMKEIGVQKTAFDSLALKENIALSMADILTFNSSVFVKSYGRATLSTVAFRGTSPSHT
ncbi:MAG: TonB-dependent receptor, partial [Muribaculaceae bacterium]|nr:TonB-dependent receptor [Muribaculaceae bacterium]